MKYTTLAALKAALDSGELKLNGDEEKLTVDNDCTTLYVGPEFVTVFDMHPTQLLEEALTLLGIPWQYA